MKSLTKGIYCMLGPTEDRNECFLEKKFDKEITVKEILGTISSFPKVHVMLVVTIEPIDMAVAYPENDKVIFIINSGSAGTANNSIQNLDIKTDKLYFYWWAHNMKWWFWCDFHGDLIVYYEDG